MGGWLQQWHQAKTAREQRQEERRYTAGQAALDMFIRFRHATASRIDDNEGVDAWTEAFVEWSVTFDGALYLVPDGDEMRKRVFGIMGLVGYHEELGQNHREANLWIDALCREAIGVLSAFLRRGTALGTLAVLSGPTGDGEGSPSRPPDTVMTPVSSATQEGNGGSGDVGEPDGPRGCCGGCGCLHRGRDLAAAQGDP